jgi:hypothetical protein
MAGLVPAIHVFLLRIIQDVDGRDKKVQDALRAFAQAWRGEIIPRP